MKIKFCGAARTVTGSQHLLEIDGKKILLDCGLYQGKRSEAYDINRNFLFDPKEIHSIVLSHAHIDHSGNLPTISRKGFTGDIYATAATRDLCAVMLQDSAHIQEKDLEYANRKRKRDGLPPFKPLYDYNDARNIMKCFKSVAYNRKFNINGFGGNVSVTFFDAGHILGSAQVLLEINEKGRTIRFGFSGDVGRPHLPILRDPDSMGNVNYLICESTYGGRVHDKASEMDEQLLAVLQEALSRLGKIIVPAFSLGRTQEIVFALSKLFAAGKLERFPIFVDSPLSSNVSEIFKTHPECFDRETAELLSKGEDIFGFSNLTYIRDAEESKRLNDFKSPCMIISASGMCESGRVLHHLKNSVSNERNTVLIVGYQAPETLGRRLVESKDTPGSSVRIFGDVHPVKSKIYVLNSFSAHADRDELIDYFSNFDKSQLEQVWLVHGDYDQQQALQSALNERGLMYVDIPEKGKEVEI